MSRTYNYSEKNMGAVCSVCSRGKHNIRAVISILDSLPLDVRNL
jgi:hypothetical protein